MSEPDITLQIDIYADTCDIEVYADRELRSGQTVGILDMVATAIHESSGEEPVIIEDMDDLRVKVLDAPEPQSKPKLRRVK